jgi:signal transduction histidine kinase
VSQNAGTLKISFRDDGVGIEGAALPKIFEPFYTTHRTRGGSGLGLYLVYNMITQKMNGTIDCKSVQGMGTEFLICLPMTTPPPTPEQK